jgi:hypothetical protein
MIFVLVFVRKIGLGFAVVFSLSNLGISVRLASNNEFGSVLSLSILCNSLRSTEISSLKVWQN